MTRNLRFAAAAAAVGATLFVQARQRRAPRSYPMRSGFAAGLHFLQRGAGAPVVLLH